MVTPASNAAGSRWTLLVALPAILALAGLGALAARGHVDPWERALFESVNGLGAVWWPPLYLVMQVGTLAAGPVTAAVALLAGRRRLAGQLAGAGVTAWLLARGLKWVVGRPRPLMLVPTVVLRGDEAGGLGYPSGHVSVAMALATVLVVWLPGRWRWLPWAVVAVVGLARMYAGAHLPLDVVGGVLLGGLVGGGIRAIARSGGRSPREP